MKEKFKKYWCVGIIFICLILMCFIYDSNKVEEIESDSSDILYDMSVEEKIIQEKSYFVDIKGEVKKPGVYEIESDKRIIDVINKAGGLTKKVTDEMSIKIYS